MNLSDTQCVFTPNAGKVEGLVNCGVCGQRMDVKINVVGPTSMVESMAGSKHRHDRFTCPDRDEKWHMQVVALRREQRKSASTMIGALLQQEIDMVLETKEPTKELSVHTGM